VSLHSVAALAIYISGNCPPAA